MATPNVLNILRGKARLIASPTNLAAAYPYGGTVLGIVRGIEVVIEPEMRFIAEEGWGGQKTEAVYSGEGVMVVGVLRTFDNDLYSSIFPWTATGTSGKKLVKYDVSGSGAVRAGTKLGEANSIKLLVAPLAPARHPGFLLYRAIPMIQSAARIGYGLKAEMGVPFSFIGTPDSSGRVYRMGIITDFTL